MLFLTDRLRRIEDRINPVAVRELRQATMSHRLMALLCGFLLANLAVIGLATLSREIDPTERAVGREVFGFLLVCLIVAAVVVMPTVSAVRFLAQRVSTDTDLILVTPLTGRNLFWGRVNASFFETVLVISSSAPFLMLTYLLRGVDVVTIAAELMIVLAAAWVNTWHLHTMAMMSRKPLGVAISAAIAALAMAVGLGLLAALTTGVLHEGIGVLFSGWAIFAAGMVGVFYFAPYTISIALIAREMNRRIPGWRQAMSRRGLDAHGHVPSAQPVASRNRYAAAMKSEPAHDHA